MTEMRKREKGFTLIELLMVIAVLAILIILLLPNLQMAIQKTKQKETMGSIISIATACAHYVTDTGYAPLAGTQSGEIEANSEFVKIVAPIYLKSCPLTDEWGHALLVYTGEAVFSVYDIPEDDIGDDDFLIVSLGRDGLDGGNMMFTYNASNLYAGLYTMDSMADFMNDLINLNGTWIHAPVSYKKD